MRIIFCIFLSMLVSSSVLADYCATGKVEGNVCSGFIIESCKFIKIDAVKDGVGNLFNMKRCYEDVSEYKSSKSLCWINTKSKGMGLISTAMNMAVQPDFLHKNSSGEYEDVDAEYIVFKCKKR